MLPAGGVETCHTPKSLAALEEALQHGQVAGDKLQELISACYALEVGLEASHPKAAQPSPKTKEWVEHMTEKDGEGRRPSLIMQGHWGLLTRSVQERCAQDSEWYSSAVSAFRALTLAVEDPKARRQLYALFFSLLKRRLQNGSSQGFTAVNFITVCGVALRGVTDVWSEIRKDCSAKLADIAWHLPLDAYEGLYTDLLATAVSGQQDGVIPPWQVVHGALLGLKCLLRKIKEIRAPEGARMHQLGQDMVVDRLPCFFNSSLPSLLKLVEHPQLYVREKAVEVITALLKLGDDAQALEVLEGLMAILVGRRGADVIDGHYRLACGVVSLLTPEDIVTRWPSVVAAFQPGLANSASTVRQAAARFFGLVARKSCQLTVLTLSAVCRRMDAMLESTGQMAWEGLEGVLLIYEDIVNHLLLSRLRALEASPPPPRSVYIGAELPTPPSIAQMLERPPASSCAHLGCTDTSDPLPLPPPPSTVHNAESSAMVEGDTQALLSRMVDHVEVCSDSTQFEMRRMAGQVSSSLARLLCWVNVDALAQPWQRRSNKDAGGGAPAQLLSRSDIRRTAFACDFIRSAVRHARHVAEIHAEWSASESCIGRSGTTVASAVLAQPRVVVAASSGNRWGSRPDGVAGADFVEAYAEVLTSVAAKGQYTQAFDMVAGVHSLAVKILPLVTERSRALRSEGELMPTVLETLFILRTFIRTLEVDGMRHPLGIDDFQEALLCLTWIHKTAYLSGRTIPASPTSPGGAWVPTAHPDYVGLIQSLAKELDVPSSSLRISTLSSKAFGDAMVSSPRFAVCSQQKKAVLADQGLSVAMLHYLPSLAATVHAKQALHLVPFIAAWLCLRDDKRWLSVRSTEVATRLVTSLAVCLRPVYNLALTFQRSDSNSPMDGNSEPLRSLSNSIDLQAQDDDGGVERWAQYLNAHSTDTKAVQHVCRSITAACCTCMRALKGLLSEHRLDMDSACFRKLLWIVYMSCVIMPDLRSLHEVLPSLCRYIRRWHLQSLTQESEAEGLRGVEQADDSEALAVEEERWDDWDEPDDGGKEQLGPVAARSAGAALDAMSEFLWELRQRFQFPAAKGLATGLPPPTSVGHVRPELSLIESWRAQGGVALGCSLMDRLNELQEGDRMLVAELLTRSSVSENLSRTVLEEV